MSDEIILGPDYEIEVEVPAYARDGDVLLAPGDDAYALAVKNGFSGTVSQWLASLEGDDGEQGPQGVPGAQGQPGIQGLKGDKGDTGEKGDQGDQGIPGEKGDTGDTGPVGEAGTTFRGVWSGATAYATRDVVRYEGDNGVASAYICTVANTNQAPAEGGDNTWWSLYVQEGARGPQGLKGDQGDQGIPGAEGPKGDKGDDGEQGIPGEQGEQGIPGIQGIPGAKGDKGDQGDPATNLVTSVAGRIGPVVLDKSDVGLPLADNTPDSAKPLSGPQQTALDAATFGLSANAFTDAVGKIRAGVQDVTIMAIGDSLTASRSGGWIPQLAALLATYFPTHTVKILYWTPGANDTIAGSYDAPVTISTGTGSKIITLVSAAVSGKTWQYHTDIIRREAMLAAPLPDVAMIMLNHNEDQTAAQAGNMAGERGKVLGQLGEVERILERGDPSAPSGAMANGFVPIVLMSCNPLFTVQQANGNRADMFRRIARMVGYGFVDVERAFREDGRTIFNTLVNVDGVHPTTVGYGIIANLIMAEIKKADRSYNAAPMQQRPLFSISAENLITDGALTNLDGSNKPAGWTLNNVTASINTTQFETKGKSLTLTKTTDGAGVALVRIPLPSWVRTVGGVFTAAARIYIPSGQANVVGQVGYYNGSTTVQNYVWNQYDQWIWRVFTFKVAPGASAAEVRLQVANSSGNLPGTIHLDRIDCVRGSLPAELDVQSEILLEAKAPTAYVDSIAKMATQAVTVAATLTLGTATDTLVTADMTSGGYSLTLPTTTVAGRRFIITKTSFDNNVLTVAAGAGGSVSGGNSFPLAGQWETAEVVSTGVADVWRLVAIGRSTIRYQNRSAAFAVRTASAGLNVSSAETQFMDCTSGNLTLTLPQLAASSGLVFTIKKTDATANTCTVSVTSAGTIDGAASYVLANVGDTITVQCTNSTGAYRVIGSSVAPTVYRSATAAATLTGVTAANYVINADATTAGFSLTLPSTTVPGIRYTVKKTDSTSNLVNVVGTVIDNFGSTVSLFVQHDLVELESTAVAGTWMIVGGGRLPYVRYNNHAVAVATRTTTPINLGQTAAEIELYDCTAQAIATNLPNASSAVGLHFLLKKIDATSNAVTITVASGGTIDGLSSITLNTQGDGIIVACSAAGVWRIVSSSFTTTTFARTLLDDADARTARATLAAANAQAMFPTLRSGLYYPTQGYAGIGTGQCNGTNRGSFLILARTASIDRIAAEITTVGTAGSVVRLGLWSYDWDTNLATLMLDAGTIDGTVLGAQEIAITPTQLVGGETYLLTATGQGSPTTQPVIRVSSFTDNRIGSTLATAVSSQYGPGGQIGAAATTGALPTGPQTLIQLGTGGCARLAVRAV